MKLVTYEISGREALGVLSGDGRFIFPLKSLGVGFTSMLELIEGISDPQRKLLEQSTVRDPGTVCGALAVEEAKLLAPIPKPAQDVICLGINYMAHAEESARYNKEAFSGERPWAVYFSKRVNRAVGPYGVIPAHAGLVEDLDYEVELAVIIGKEAKNVRPQDASQYVFGYTVVNDVSARTLQTRHQQWYFGKSLDGFLPMGPCIVTKEEVAYPPQLAIHSRVNGQLRQDSNTRNLIFGIDHIISELSAGMTLCAGTVIATGTPAGAGMGFHPPRFLRPGDVVECTIEGIGTLTNTVEG